MNYTLRNVTVSILVFYAVVLLFDARGLYNWTQKLPVSEPQRIAGEMAKRHWERMAALGLEEPKHTIETAFLAMTDAHPLLMPRKYADIQRRREEKARKKAEMEVAEAADPKLKEQRVAAKQLLDPEERLPEKADPKVLVVGDSIMMSVGPVIKKDVLERLGGAAVVKAKLATGLARPDVFDWPKEVKRLTTQRRYDYVVMMFGTNDSQNFVEHGQILTYGTPEWVKAYTQRLDSIMAAACGSARKGLWIGLPPMQSDAFNRKALRLNSWAKRKVAEHECMEFVALDKVIGDEKGRYVSYRKIDEHVEKIRMVDGIHVTARGGTLISSALMGLMGPSSESLAH